MNKRHVRWLATILSLSAGTSAVIKCFPHADSILTMDVNHDGEPDVWRVDDVENHLTEVFRDTNHDGQRDIREYYEHGVLVRRESDRDFNNQIDLVEDFDAATGDRSRSVVDLDSDGRADLLVLFLGADAVFVKAAPQRAATSAVRHATNAPVHAGTLLPFDDPFDGDLALRPLHPPIRAQEFVGLSTAGGVPAEQQTSLDVPRAGLHPSDWRVLYTSGVELQPGPPRGPPPPLL